VTFWLPPKDVESCGHWRFKWITKGPHYVTPNNVWTRGDVVQGTEMAWLEHGVMVPSRPNCTDQERANWKKEGATWTPEPPVAVAVEPYPPNYDGTPPWEDD